jgi:3'(2'), 5'-bisphosphate nucleotidase
MGSFDQERQLAREATRKAAHLCLAVRGEMLLTPERMEKAGREPVTIADYGSQAVILHEIADRFPGDASLAEERADEFLSLTTRPQRQTVAQHIGAILGNVPTEDDLCHWLDYGQEGSSIRVWTIDPIDGTKGFLRGDQFAIAVALLVEGRLTVAALACPLLPYDPGSGTGLRGVIATAVRSQGATLEPLVQAAPRPMRVSPMSDFSEARVVESVEKGHSDHSYSGNVFRRASVTAPSVQMDSQAKYVTVADGRAEIYFRHSPAAEYREKVWDHAAGALIVQEAGGRVTDEAGRPLDFSCGKSLAANEGILATNGWLHEGLLEAIRAVG